MESYLATVILAARFRVPALTSDWLQYLGPNLKTVRCTPPHLTFFWLGMVPPTHGFRLSVTFWISLIGGRKCEIKKKTTVYDPFCLSLTVSLIARGTYKVADTTNISHYFPLFTLLQLVRSVRNKDPGQENRAVAVEEWRRPQTEVTGLQVGLKHCAVH